MHFVAKLVRLIHIKYVFLKYGLDKFIWSNPHFHPIKWLVIFFPWRWFGEQPKPTGEAIRLALSDLGPIFVKFGQLLSTRRDLLPDEVANELAKLQDCVPPFSGELAKNMIEKSLQQPLTAVFSDFNLVPLASASISQVHSATLLTGERVVVKVLRPNIHQQVLQDIELMETIALFLEKFVKNSRRLRPIDVVAEIKQTLIDELDLLREAANASQLRRNFINADSLYVPQIYWQQSRKDVLVIERVHGIPISNIQKLKAHNTNLKVLAERGVEIFFTQVFRDCFFHADMHPGNIFVTIDSPDDPKYVAVDFGIMGTLGPDDQRYLGENFLAFFKRDYRKVAELHVQSGWVPPTTPIHAFEAAIRTVCEPIFEKPLKEISFAQTLIRLFQTAQRFDMQIQPQLLLLQKTLLSIEGLGRQLYPDLDLWQTAKPFLEKWMKKHYGPQAFFSELWNRLPQWTDKLPEIPEAIYDIARFYQDETHRLKYQQTPASAVVMKDQLLKLSHKHIGRKIIGTALLVCATIIGLNSPHANIIQEYSSWLIGAGLGVGLIMLLI